MDLATSVTAIGGILTATGIIGSFFWKASKQNTRISNNAERIEELKQENNELWADYKAMSEHIEERDATQAAQVNKIETSLAVIRTNQEQYTKEMLRLISKQDDRLEKMDIIVTELKELTIRLEERLPDK
mgnify:CR=1 FL=1